MTHARRGTVMTVEDAFDEDPETLGEAIDLLREEVSGDLREKLRHPFKFMEHEEEGWRIPKFGMLHMGLGMGLRNAWDLWYDSDLADWFAERGIYHADDMSGAIMACLHWELAGKDWESRFDRLVQYYQAYWWEEHGYEPEDMKRKRLERLRRI